MAAMTSRTCIDRRRESSVLPERLRVAALGGGTGLPTVLRGLCSVLYAASPEHDNAAAADRLVAIVATSDDGGSSGRLRREFGSIPPGDIRNCLTATAQDRSILADLFQYRFAAGDGLQGHALGNLILEALAEITGDFAKGVDVAARIVGARARILPATADSVVLSATLLDGRTITGETAIVAAGAAIARLSLLPRSPRPVAAALDALRRADLIVVGPGSLYTSILPPLLIPEVLQALRTTDAIRVLVLNLMTEPGETDGFDAARHLEVVSAHLGEQMFDYVIFNTTAVPAAVAARYAASGSHPIVITPRDISLMRDRGIQPLGAPLASEEPLGRMRHHPGRLAATITACARFGDHRRPGRDEDNNVRTFL
jgi:uncharacterized cofD-like protein